MRGVLNLIHREIARARMNWAVPRIGEVSLYDKDRYLVKVKIQPEGYETGWIPLATPYAGKDFGMMVGPCLGDQVLVEYQESDYQTGVVTARLFNEVDTNPRPAPECGEVFIIHKSGTFLKLKDNGDIEVHAEGKIISDATLWEHTGDVEIDGKLDVTGNIHSDATVDGDSDVKTGLISLKSHTHSGVESGGSNTGPPS